jgi:hypothetical protein
MAVRVEPPDPSSRRVEALRHLPPVYSLALRLRDVGVPEELLAECLGVEPEAMGPLFEVAQAKLAAILERGLE